MHLSLLPPIFQQGIFGESTFTAPTSAPTKRLKTLHKSKQTLTKRYDIQRQWNDYLDKKEYYDDYMSYYNTLLSTPEGGLAVVEEKELKIGIKKVRLRSSINVYICTYDIYTVYMIYIL